MCKTSPCSCCHKYGKHTALLVLRVALAVIFIMHGYAKLFGVPPTGGMAGFTGMVTRLDFFPFPGFFAYMAALSEFVGGIAVLLGVFTRLTASFLVVVMLVALILVKQFRFPAADVDLALLGIALSLVLMGPGRFSLSGLLKKKEDVPSSCCGGHGATETTPKQV